MNNANHEPEVYFSYTNEFGDWIDFSENLNLNSQSEFDAIVESFKAFMLAAGFAYASVQEIYPEK